MPQANGKSRRCPCTDRQFFFISATAVIISFLGSWVVEWNSLLGVTVVDKLKDDLSLSFEQRHSVNLVGGITIDGMCVADLGGEHCTQSRCCNTDAGVAALVKHACCLTCRDVKCSKSGVNSIVSPVTSAQNPTLGVATTTPNTTTTALPTKLISSVVTLRTTTNESIPIGRVWSFADSESSPLLPSSASSLGNTSAPYDKPRCDKGDTEPGNCDLLHPIPDVWTRSKKEELPRYESTCLWQFEDTQTTVLPPPPPTKDILRRVSATIGTTAEACQDDCLAAATCIGWTHRASSETIGERLGLSDPNEVACVLYAEFHVNSQALTAKNNNKRCTTGRVRTGRARSDTAASQTLDSRVLPSSADNPLILIDLPQPGSCHGRDCFDVHHCAARFPKDKLGKVAFVFTDDLRRRSSPPGKLRNLMDSPAQRRRLLAAKVHNADLVLVVPAQDVATHPLSDTEIAYFAEVGMKVVAVPWLTPPGLTTFNKGCGYMDLIRLHAWRLVEYDAVIVIDTDYTVMGDMGPIFRCAAQNYVVTTSGPLSPLNLGFVALKPDNRTMHAIEMYGASVDYTKETGWAGAGFKPSGGQFIGAGCGQGYLWTFFYKNGERVESEPIAKAWHDAGIARPRSFQVCRCLWNFQGDRTDSCGKDFSCGQVRGMHKRIKLKFGKDNQDGKGCFYHFS
eukprot:m.202887 g.202887  ORF g.202887 m.202887 type:complete len:679 (+) comp32838_c0_seq1:506-2542(+)